MLNIFFREWGCIFSPLRLMNIITARYDLCAPFENSAPHSQSRSRTSVTNVGSTKTRRKVTSENGCRQASMSKSYFNDIFSYFSQPVCSPEVAYPCHKWLLAIFTQTRLWKQMLFAGIYFHAPYLRNEYTQLCCFWIKLNTRQNTWTHRVTSAYL